MVVLPPRFDDPASVTEPQEPVLVEAFVAEAAIEALADRVLDRLAGIDKAQFDAVLIRPLVQRLAGQFGAVIEHDLGGHPALGGDAGQDLHHAFPGRLVSTSIASASRVRTSTTVSNRMRRPAASVSLRKSSAHC